MNRENNDFVRSSRLMGIMRLISRHSALIVGLLMISSLWTSVYLYLQLDREKSHQAAIQNSGNLARAFEEHVLRSIKEIDKTILYLRHTYQMDPENFDLVSWTNNAYHLKDIILQIAIIDQNGILIGTNVSRAASRMDLSDREHFRVHVNAARDDLFISKPLLGRATGKWSVQITRKIMQSDGSFGGVIVASLDPYNLSGFYNSIDLGKNGVITLVGTDGIIRARGGSNIDALGRSITGSALFREMALKPDGYYMSDGVVDNIHRLVSYRALKDFPLIVTVAISQEEILHDYEARRHTIINIASALTLLVILGMLISLRHSMWLERARHAQRHSELRAFEKSLELQTTLEHMSQGIMMIDARRHVRVVNRRTCELLDLPPGMLDNHQQLDDIIHEKMSEGEFDSLTAETGIDIMSFVKEGRLRDGLLIYERVRPNGTVLEVRTVPLPDGGVVLTWTDITERKRYEKALGEARDKAETASRARSAFLAMISHEIRTPLNGVIGMANLLMGTDLNSDQRHYARTLEGSAEHLLQIISDVLDFSKLEADRVEIENIPVDIHQVVHSAIEILAPPAHEKGLVITANIDPATPRSVCADPGRLRQVLLNLAGNGVKFTEKGVVSIDLAPDADVPAENGFANLCFTVLDTGIGIEEKSLPSLFQEFSQVDGSISRRFGGTGLGLAISRKLIEGMGGQISVESVLGEGTCFRFTLRLACDQADQTRHDEHPVLAARDILAIGFDKALEPALRNALHGQTATLHMAASPNTVNPDRTFDTVLIDWACLPRPAGMVARRLKSLPELAKARFVLVAPLGQHVDAADMPTIGFDAMIHRPLAPDTLLNTLSQLENGTFTSTSPRDAAVAGPQQAPSSAGYHVLLAEDNATNTMVATALLKKMGHTVTAVTDGAQAVEAVRDRQFDLVLMDVMMPVMDGLTATRIIRESGLANADLPIIALTANAMKEDREAAMVAGVDGFASKPITSDRLRASIDEVMQDRKLVAGTPAVEPVPDTAAAPLPAPMPVAPDIFEPQVLRAFIADMGNDNARMIMGVFFRDTAARLDQLEHGMDDRLMISREAHAIKSAAATFGFKAMSRLALDIEKQATRMDAEQLTTAIADLRNKFDEAHTISVHADFHLDAA